MTHEEWEHFVRLADQACGVIEEAAPEVIGGSPSRGVWWDAVEELRQAGERLTSACAAVQGKG